MEDLTPREKAVIKYAAQGLSNTEIAKIMFVSQHTIKAYIASALKKFAARNRTNLIYEAMKRNVIE